MAYIAPNTTIRLCRNVPLDNTYRDTINFTSKSNQQSYFAGQAKYSFESQSYQRVGKGVLRIARKADDLYDCNYLMFQNTSFGTRWFYAFVTGVEYVNNETSDVSYEIDVLQTWQFDYTWHPSFIEREHSATDNVGDNLVPDSLELGDYVSDDFDGTGSLGAKYIIVAATFDENLDDVAGGTYGGIYSGLCFNAFTSASDANDFIDEATSNNKQSGIVSVFMMPADFYAGPGEGVKTLDITKTKKIDNINGYVPKNRKLFTYPYNFLYVTNLNGTSAEYHYEYFSGTDCKFLLTGDTSCNPTVVLAPYDYKGVPVNFNEKMTLDGWPQCAYNTDSFKAWLAQTGASSLVSLVGGAAVSGIAAGAGSGAAAGAGALGTVAAGTGLAVAGAPIAIAAGVLVASKLAEGFTHYTMPPQASNATGSSAMLAIGIKDFAFMHMHIRREFAIIIDEYWSMYGYPSHRIKLPNLSNRPHWNYVKTIGANITGSIPAPDLAKIASIFDNGVTLWKTPSEVGHYELDNSISGA